MKTARPSGSNPTAPSDTPNAASTKTTRAMSTSTFEIVNGGKSQAPFTAATSLAMYAAVGNDGLDGQFARSMWSVRAWATM